MKREKKRENVRKVCCKLMIGCKEDLQDEGEEVPLKEGRVMKEPVVVRQDQVTVDDACQEEVLSCREEAVH